MRPILALLLCLLAFGCRPHPEDSAGLPPVDSGPVRKLTAGVTNVTEWNLYNDGGAGQTFLNADYYVLVPAAFASGVVQRVSGANTGGVNAYLFLFDENGTGVPSTNPVLSLGYVTQQATFSLDLTSPGAGSLAGRVFKNGLKIGSSSTGNSYTRSATATISCDVESN